MAVKLFDNFPVWLWAQKSILFIFYCRHGLQMKIFPVKIIWDVFDNFPVWLWTFLTILLCGHDPTNLSAKSLTIFLCGFLTIFLSGFLTIFLWVFLTIFRFPYINQSFWPENHFECWSNTVFVSFTFNLTIALTLSEPTYFEHFYHPQKVGDIQCKRYIKSKYYPNWPHSAY